MGEFFCTTGLSYYSALDFLHFVRIFLEKCVELDTFLMSLNACHVEQKDYFLHFQIILLTHL